MRVIENRYVVPDKKIVRAIFLSCPYCLSTLQVLETDISTRTERHPNGRTENEFKCGACSKTIKIDGRITFTHSVNVE